MRVMQKNFYATLTCVSRKTNVVVVCGGLSAERDISLKTGTQVARALPKEKYVVSLLDIKKDYRQLFKILGRKKIDVAFIALHGKYGEDGKIQAVFDLLGIPYTGSGVLASATGMHKAACLELVSAHGIRAPRFFLVRGKHKKLLSDLHRSILAQFGYPCVVKPNGSGSSIGVSIVKEKKQLAAAYKKASAEDELTMIQEYIAGRELTCGVLGNTGATKLFALPPVEIIARGTKFFDYHAKYFSKNTEEICPAPVSERVTKEIKNTAARVHEILGCDGLTRSDFMLSQKSNELYFLEINTIPGQTEASLCPKEAKALGIPFSAFIEKQIRLAMKK